MRSLEIEIPEGHEIDEKNSTFSKIVFREIKKDVLQRIQSLQDAEKDLGEGDDAVMQLHILRGISGLSSKILAEQETVVMAKALNEGWIPDFTDDNEAKWYIWWDLSSGTPVFYCSDCYVSLCYSSARLCTRTKALSHHLAKIAARQFERFISY